MRPVNSDEISLQLDNLELARGGRVLLSGLSLSLAPGQLALVTGPNGSGKTTLLRALAGLAPPARGRIRICGQAVGALESATRGVLAYQAHAEGLKKDLTVEENIIFNQQIRGSDDEIDEVMAELGLDAISNRLVRQLSAGQKRRVTLANLKLSLAKIWLLDEPLTNLDAAGSQLVADWLELHLEAGGIAVVATHLADNLRRPGCFLVEF
jgi:heme exporter protein A